MKKSSFVALVLGSIAVMLSAIGICMCLLPQWNALRPGIIVGGLGLLLLLITLLVYRKMENKPPIHITMKMLSSVLVGIGGALLLGVGMCFSMLFNNMLSGIIIGILGISMLISLIPLTKGVY